MKYKGKGAITIEAVILIPLLFLVILLIFDLSINAYLRTTITSNVASAVRSIEYEIKSKNDADITALKHYSISPQAFIYGRIERTISDELHLGIHSDVIKARVTNAIQSNTFINSCNVKVKVYKFLFTTYISVDYQVDISGFMDGFYRKIGSSIGTMKSRESIVIKDYFDMIAFSESVVRAMKSSVSISEILDGVNNIAYYIAKIIGG